MKLLALAFVSLALAGTTQAQTCALVNDINTMAGIGLSSSPGGWAQLGKTYIFAATTCARGRELYKMSSTGVVSLVVDIRSGTKSSDPRDFTTCGGTVYFTAFTDTRGRELWRTNGFSLGTTLVRDIAPGSASSNPRNLTCCHNRLYFTASDRNNGTELWRSNGTSATTELLSIQAGPGSSSPKSLTCCRGELLFSAFKTGFGRELWRVGTATRTPILEGDIQRGSGSSSPGNLVSCNNVLYFSAFQNGTGTELWKAVKNTVFGNWKESLVRDIRVGSKSSFPSNIICCGKKVFFSANDGIRGSELWRSDGTPRGTKRLSDIKPGSGSSTPSNLISCGNTVLFSATGASDGQELWQTFGSTGVRRVRDINPGAGGSNMRNLTCCSGRLYFSANNGTSGNELWRASPGVFGAWTANLVKDIRKGSASSSPQSFLCIGSRVYFTANDGVDGVELWRSDGTALTTVLQKDIETTKQNASSNPGEIVCCWGQDQFFAAEDGTNGRELWVGRKSRAFWPTKLVKDIRKGRASSNPRDLTCCGKWLFFTADNGTNGRELWRSDGTPSGTQLVKDIRPGASGSNPTQLTCCGDILYFTANDGKNGTELWRSNGTSSGTTLVRNILSGALSSAPKWLTCCKGVLYFSAISLASGRELWRSNGTFGGTVQVRDIRKGSASSNPRDLICGGRTLYFAANNGTNGEELWRSGGTAASTIMVADIRPGSASSSPRHLTFCEFANGTVFFSAIHPTLGREFFQTRINSRSVVFNKDTRPGAASGNPSNIVCCGAQVFFTANNGTNGTELWRTRAVFTSWSPANIVKDIYPGGVSSSPSKLTCVGRRVYFSAREPNNGRELWKSDGSSAGTQRVCDLFDCSPGSSPAKLALCCGQLFFAATGTTVGRELYRIRLPGASTQILGSTCPPFHLVATATTPKLGTTVFLTGTPGPANHIGVIVCGRTKVKPTSAVRGVTNCPLWFDLSSFFIVATVVPPFPTVGLTIPNSTSLNGTTWVYQTVWINLLTVFPLQATNGVQLNLGN